MKSRALQVLSILYSILLLFPAVGVSKSRIPREIVDGTVEFTHEKIEIFRLKGDWRFADRNLTEMDGTLFASLPFKSAYKGSLYWTSYFPGPARGSFVLKLHADRAYALDAFTPAVTARSQILVINEGGVKEAFVDPEYGKESLKNTRRELGNVTFPLELAQGDNFIVLNYEQQPIRVGGVESVSAGFTSYMDIGPRQEFQSDILQEKVTLLIPTGIFLCLAVYSLLIYVSRRGRDRESLFLFCFNIVMFFKEVASQSIVSLFMPSNAFTQQLNASIMYTPLLTTYFAMTVVSLTLNTRFMKYCKLFVLLLSACSLVINVILASGTHIPDLQNINLIFLVCNSANFMFVFLPYLLLCAFRIKSTELVLLAFGYLALLGGICFDYYKATTGIDFPWMAMWGGTVLSIVFAKNNSQMFARTYERSEQLNRDLQVKNAEVQELNASLEVKVLERTEEVRSLLQHIPQGILTIGEGGCIEPNYSAHLPEIIGSRDISGKSFRDVVFGRSALSQDAIDQAWQTILASLGEDPINFEVNLGNLPTEFSFQGAQPMVLKCTWNVEVDKAGQVKRILVTLLDVSAEVEARKKLDEKNKEFDIVRQLIEIGGSKAKQFFSSGHQLLMENNALIHSSHVDSETVKILFVNMHTLKGAARTLQLIAMSDAFHHVETYYAEILRSGAAIDPARLKADFKPALAIFEQYETVNRTVLGRTEDDSKVVIDREFLERNFQILNYLDHASSLDSSLKGIIHDNCDRLVKLIFMSLPLVLDDIMKQAGRIAKDLQKAEPMITLDMGDLLINYKQELALKNAFVHLLRNALDHGIETPEVRMKKGKDPRGRITLHAVQKGGQIEIRFEDDGAGLALGRLRQKGRDLQLLKGQAAPEDVAELIFHQGMSTAKAVSQISGRGIGMDAVRRFIESESGQVEVKLDECIDRDNEIFRFHLLIRLPCHENGEGIQNQVA